jgi:hypothetical protein
MPATLVIEDTFASWLMSLEAVATTAGGRVQPWQKVSQGTARPYVAYALVAGDRLRSTKGATTGVSWARIQVDVVSRSYAEVKSLAAAIRSAVESQFSRHQVNGVSIQSARVHGRRDAVANPAFGDEGAEPRETFEVTIWFQEFQAITD